MKAKGGISEWLIVGLVILISVGANLPDDLTSSWGVNRDYLLLGLIATVVVALLQYLKFSLFLVIVVMAIGANLPGDMAAKLNVSPTAMLIALVVMVGISLFNYIWKILPTGVEPKIQIKSSEGTKALFHAIEKGNAKMLQRILEMDVDVNMRGEDGNTPLILAVQSGNQSLVQLILKKKVDIQAVNATGYSAHDIALQLGFLTIAEAIRFALEEARYAESKA